MRGGNLMFQSLLSQGISLLCRRPTIAGNGPKAKWFQSLLSQGISLLGICSTNIAAEIHNTFQSLLSQGISLLTIGIHCSFVTAFVAFQSLLSQGISLLGRACTSTAIPKPCAVSIPS